MQLNSGDVFIFSIWLAIIYLLWMPATWLLMRFLTPKQLVERYFKKPHFTNAELALFSHFPGTLMRTGIFMNLCVLPKKGKKRKIINIRDNVSNWYVVLSHIFVFFALGQGLLFIVLLFGSSAHILLSQT